MSIMTLSGSGGGAPDTGQLGEVGGADRGRGGSWCWEVSGRNEKNELADIPISLPESDILRLYGHFFTPPPGHHYFSNRFQIGSLGKVIFIFGIIFYILVLFALFPPRDFGLFSVQINPVGNGTSG